MANGLPTSATSAKFRVSYPCLFTPQLNKLNGQMEYSIQALFPKDADMKALQEIVKNAKINKWGSDEKKWPAKIRSPFKDQKELIDSAIQKDRDHGHLEAGAAYATFKSAAVSKKTGKPNPPPTVVGKNPKEVIVDESKIYGGCWAKANVNAGAYEKGGNCGVALYLNAVQFVGDGESFGGKPNPESAFEAIPEDEVNASADEMFS